MRFEREAPAFAEPISAAELKVGSVYFAVQYFDDDLLTPGMEALFLSAGISVPKIRISSTSGCRVV